MNQSKHPLLAVSHLSVMYQQEMVVDDISFCVPEGVTVGIVGPNGAGKSSLLKAIMGIITPAKGSTTIEGLPLCHARKRVAYIPQKNGVDWDFPITVFEVALMGRYVHLGWFTRPASVDKQIAMRALDAVGMSLYAHTPIGSLSGGQQQRVFLARALAQQADLYIMDEPFVGVDSTTQELMVALFKNLCGQGKTVIMVHHDLQSLESYFDTLIVLNKTIIAYDTVKNVLHSDALQKAYKASSHYFFVRK